MSSTRSTANSGTIPGTNVPRKMGVADAISMDASKSVAAERAQSSGAPDTYYSEIPGTNIPRRRSMGLSGESNTASKVAKDVKTVLAEAPVRSPGEILAGTHY